VSEAASEADHHDEFYASERGQRIFASPLTAAKHERQLRLLRAVTPAHARVLSVGCGDGGKEIAAACYVREVVGVDVSTEAVRIAAKAAADVGVGNVSFYAGDARDVVRAGPFDAVWALALLHHIPTGDMPQAVADLVAVLRPGGVFVSIDPNARRLVRHLKRLVGSFYEETHSPDERELLTEEVLCPLEAAGCQARVIWQDFAMGTAAWLVTASVPMPLARAALRVDSWACRIPGLGPRCSEFAVVGVKR
jgi:SAM-dependent methyltransferase